MTLTTHGKSESFEWYYFYYDGIKLGYKLNDFELDLKPYEHTYYDWDWQTNYYDRQMIRQEENIQDWWQGTYKDWLRSQDVEEGYLVGW